MITAIEQPLTESDVVGAVAIGEEAIVADTMEAVWQSVQQKAADELIGIECHHLGDAALSVVLPGEAHLPVGEREEPAVGDSDAMGVAAEIGQYLFDRRKVSMTSMPASAGASVRFPITPRPCHSSRFPMRHNINMV